MKKYKGGCAIMLKLWDPKRQYDLVPLLDPAMKWAADRGDCKKVDVEDYHLTLQFVGRDLSGSEAALVITSAFAFAEESGPLEISFNGKFVLHGTSKGQYLVAKVEPTDALKTARERIRQLLRSASITIKDPFPFSPHVTLTEEPPADSESGADVEGAPDFSIPPLIAKASQIEVKYGPHRMLVEL